MKYKHLLNYFSYFHLYNYFRISLENNKPASSIKIIPSFEYNLFLAQNSIIKLLGEENSICKLM